MFRVVEVSRVLLVPRPRPRRVGIEELTDTTNTHRYHSLLYSSLALPPCLYLLYLVVLGIGLDVPRPSPPGPGGLG